MELYSKCPKCKKKKWFIRNRRFISEKLKETLIPDTPMCNECAKRFIILIASIDTQ